MFWSRKIQDFVIVNWHADLKILKGYPESVNRKSTGQKKRTKKKKKTVIPRLQNVVDNYEMKA